MKKGHKDFWYNSKLDIRLKGELVKRIRKHKPNLGDVLVAVQDNGKRLEKVESAIVEIKKDVVEIKKDVAENKKNIVEVKKDVAENKKNIVEVKKDVVKINTRLDNIVTKNKLSE